MADPTIKHDCSCGAPIWEGSLPRYEETIVCPQCGRDHSRNPPWRVRIRWARYSLRKRIRLYGLRRGATMLSLIELFLLPRERKARAIRKAKRTVTDGEDGRDQHPAPHSDDDAKETFGVGRLSG